MADEATRLAVARFRDGLKSDRKELNQIAVFQLNKLLSDHGKSEQVAQLIVAQDTPKLICNLLFQDHKPEVKECATCALAALAGRAAESGVYMIQSMSTFAESDGCDLKCRENIVCAFCNFSMADAMHVQLIDDLLNLVSYVELLVVGSNLAKRATAGLLTNLAGGETDAARAFRRRATDAGAVKVLRAMSNDPTVTPEVVMGPADPLTQSHWQPHTSHSRPCPADPPRRSAGTPESRRGLCARGVRELGDTLRASRGCSRVVLGLCGLVVAVIDRQTDQFNTKLKLLLDSSWAWGRAARREVGLLLGAIAAGYRIIKPREQNATRALLFNAKSQADQADQAGEWHCASRHASPFALSPPAVIDPRAGARPARE